MARVPSVDEEGGRVAIYTRVSTEDQAKEGFSLASQRDRLNAYCGARGWEVVAEYVDEGESGRSTNRPAYQRMMDEHEKWDILLVLKMDRIHRNSKNFMEMMDQLKVWGKEFNSMSESLDTSTAMGRFVMDIIQRIAQLESEQIGERVYWGMDQKAKDAAGILGFQSPYGYRNAEGVLEVVPEEATVVRLIYKLYLEGKTDHAIAQELAESGLATKQGGAWARQTVKKILQNPVYCSYLRWQDHIYAHDHEAILDVETFNDAQKARFKRARKRSIEKAPIRLAPRIA